MPRMSFRLQKVFTDAYHRLLNVETVGLTVSGDTQTVRLYRNTKQQNYVNHRIIQIKTLLFNNHGSARRIIKRKYQIISIYKQFNFFNYGYKICST